MITQRASAREGAVDSSSEPHERDIKSLFLERWMAMEVSSAQALVRPRIEPGLETMANVDQKTRTQMDGSVTPLTTHVGYHKGHICLSPTLKA